MSRRAEIDIHPAFWPGYYNMVFQGLTEAGYSVRLTPKGFPEPETAAFYVRKDTLALIVRGRTEKRIVVSADDRADVHAGQANWADVIAKVNVSDLAATDAATRLLPIGPMFGVRLGSISEMASILARKLALTPRPLLDQFTLREEYRNYFRRPPENAYRPGQAEESYVFFAATAWTAFPEAAVARAEFIRACKRGRGLEFEGGFAMLPDGDETDYPGLYVARRYGMQEYIDRTRRSLFVFNSPAAHECLGWKLGEFLALGKAIISTPLGRVMPGSFEEEEHFISTDGSPGSLDEVIARLRADTRLRRHLEQRARQYYDDYLRPVRVARRILAGLD